MTTRFNLLLIGTVIAATAAIGVAGAAALDSADSVLGKADRLFNAAVTADGFMTLEYRGDQMSVLARVPLGNF